jgi:hypothetical protein
MQRVLQKLRDFQPQEGVNYKAKYKKLSDDISAGVIKDPASAIRWHIMNDLFFFVNFVIFDDDSANDPNGFVVEKCKYVERKAKSSSRNLDIWARFHFKSTIITIALNIQRRLKNPNSCSLILSYKKGLAEEFLAAIKRILEMPVMVHLFPEILWENVNDAAKWSQREGLILKRTSAGRKDASFQTGGLVEGQNTGGHYEDIFYDDIETNDMKYNIDNLKKCYEQFDMSDNLGKATGEDMRWVVGTYYHHLGPLVNIRDERDEDDNAIWNLGFFPITEDGTRDGVPVLVTEKRHAELKRKKHYLTQHLLNPTPGEYAKFRDTMLHEVEHAKIPSNLYKVLLVDWAGDNPDEADDKKSAWAIGVIGIDVSEDEINANDIYVTDLVLKPMSLSTAIETIIKMYLRNGVVQKVGIEGTHLNVLAHAVAKELKAFRRELSYDLGNLIDLRTKGRNKVDRISDNLEWPFINGKIHICKTINGNYIDRLKKEMNMFPDWHNDGLDIISYAMDVFEDFKDFIDIRFDDNAIDFSKYQSNNFSWMSC